MSLADVMGWWIWSLGKGTSLRVGGANGGRCWLRRHYIDVITTTMASQITSLTVVYSTFYSEENIKVPRHWPLCGEFTGIGEFPAQRASNAGNVSIWWRHHEMSFFSGWPVRSVTHEYRYHKLIQQTWRFDFFLFSLRQYYMLTSHYICRLRIVCIMLLHLRFHG